MSSSNKLNEKTKDTNTNGLLEALDRVQAIIEFELDGTIINANENFLNALGYSLKEIKGQHHKMFCFHCRSTGIDVKFKGKRRV